MASAGPEVKSRHALRALGSRIRATLGSWAAVAFFGVVYVLSQAKIASILHPVGTRQVLDLQTTFSATTFAAIVHGWQANGAIDAYWHHYRYDFVHPLWYGGFLAAALSKGFDLNRIDPRHNAWLLVPVAAACLDLCENSLHVLFLSWPASVVTPLVALSGLAANLKWLLAGACTLGLVYLIARSTWSQPAKS